MFPSVHPFVGIQPRPKVTALYAVFMAPRDDLQTIDWRLRHDLTEQPEPGCIVVPGQQA